MHAIAHRCRQNGYKAVYVSCEMFTNELVTAIRTGTQEQFRAKYRTSDALLVDDVQFLAGKPSTQEELFHTFNALHEAGKQVVLACDRPPKAMSTLENRLRSRFEWGLITDIQPPDMETRQAILAAKCVSYGIDLPYALLERIAALVTTNIRELEGALTKVVAHANLNGVYLTPDPGGPPLHHWPGRAGQSQSQTRDRPGPPGGHVPVAQRVGTVLCQRGRAVRWTGSCYSDAQR